MRLAFELMDSGKHIPNVDGITWSVKNLNRTRAEEEGIHPPLPSLLELRPVDSSSLVLGLGFYTISSNGYPAFGFRLKHTPRFPGSPACR